MKIEGFSFGVGWGSACLFWVLMEKLQLWIIKNRRVCACCNRIYREKNSTAKGNEKNLCSAACYQTYIYQEMIQKNGSEFIERSGRFQVRGNA